MLTYEDEISIKVKKIKTYKNSFEKPFRSKNFHCKIFFSYENCLKKCIEI